MADVEQGQAGLESDDNNRKRIGDLVTGRDKVKASQVTSSTCSRQQEEQHSAQFTYVEADSSCDESMDSDDCWQSAAGADIRATGTANGRPVTSANRQADEDAVQTQSLSEAAAGVPQRADDDAELPCTAQSASAGCTSISTSSNQPTSVQSSPHPSANAGIIKHMDVRVAEALKILTTKSLSQSEYVTGRPASYHFDRDSSARRRYDWGTKHFYPDVHDITQPGSARRPNKRRRVIASGNGPSESTSPSVNSRDANVQDQANTTEAADIKIATALQRDKQNRERHVTTDSNSSSDESTAKLRLRTSSHIKQTKQREKDTAGVQPVASVDEENVPKEENVSSRVKRREATRGRKLSPRRHSAPVDYVDKQDSLPISNGEVPPPPESQLSQPPSPPLPPPPAPYFSPAQSLACIPLPTLESPTVYFEDFVDVGSALPLASVERLDFLDMIKDDMKERQQQEAETAKKLSFEQMPQNIVVTFQESDKPSFNFVVSRQHSEEVPSNHSQRAQPRLQVERPAIATMKSLEPPASRREFALSGRVSADDLFRINNSPASGSGNNFDGDFAYQEDLLRENDHRSPQPVGSKFYSSGSSRNMTQGTSREFVVNKNASKRDNNLASYPLSGRVSAEESFHAKRYSPVLSDDYENEYAYQEDLLHENDHRSPLPVGSKFYSSGSARDSAKGLSREFVPRKKYTNNEENYHGISQNRQEASSVNREKFGKYSMYRKSAVEVDSDIRTAADELNNALHSLDAALMSLQKIDSNVTRNAGKVSYTIRPVYAQTELDISRHGKSKIDARKIMIEEKERYREYKADYARRVSSRDSTSGDEKSRDPADPKSPVLSRSSSRGSSTTNKSQWQLLHERQETVGYKSPDVLSVEATSDDVFEAPLRGRVLVLPAKVAKQQSLLDDNESRALFVRGVQQLEKKPAKLTNQVYETASHLSTAGSRPAWRASDLTVEAVMRSVGKKEAKNVSDTESDSSCRSSVAKRELLADMGSYSPSVRAKHADSYLHRFRNKIEQDDQLFENSSQRSAVVDTLATGVGGEVRRSVETKAALAFPSRPVVEHAHRELSNQQMQKAGNGRFFVAAGNKSPLLMGEPVSPRLKQSEKPHTSTTIATGYALEFVPMKPRGSMLLSSPLLSDSEMQQSKAAAQYDSYVRDSREKYRAQFNATIDSPSEAGCKNLSTEAAKELPLPRLLVSSTDQVKVSVAQLSTRLTPTSATQQQAAIRNSPMSDNRHTQLRVVGKKATRPLSEFISSNATNLNVSSQAESAPIVRQSFVPYKSLKQSEAESITRPTITYWDKPLPSLLKPATVSSPIIPPRYSQSQWQMRDEQKSGALLKVLQVDTNLGAGEAEFYDNCPLLSKPLPSPTSAEVERYSQGKPAQMPPSVGRVYVEPNNRAAPVAVKARNNDKERVMSTSSSRDSLSQCSDKPMNQPQPVMLISTAPPSHLLEKVNKRNQNTTSLARGHAISVPNLIVAGDKGDSSHSTGTEQKHHAQQPVMLRSAKPLSESKSQTMLLTSVDSQPSFSTYSLASQAECLPEVYRSVQHLPRARQTVDYSAAPLSERSTSASAIEHGQHVADNVSAGNFIVRRAVTPGSNDHRQLTMSENIKQRLTVTPQRMSLPKDQQAVTQASNELAKELQTAQQTSAVSLTSKPRQFNVNAQRQDREALPFSARKVNKTDVATVDVRVENPVSFKPVPLPVSDEQLTVQVTCRPISPSDVSSSNSSRKNSSSQDLLSTTTTSNTAFPMRKISGSQQTSPAVASSNAVFPVRKNSGGQQDPPVVLSSVFPTRKNSGDQLEFSPAVVGSNTVFPVRKNSGGQQESPVVLSSSIGHVTRRNSGDQQDVAPVVLSSVFPVRKNSGGQEIAPTSTVFPARKNSGDQQDIVAPVASGGNAGVSVKKNSGEMSQAAVSSTVFPVRKNSGGQQEVQLPVSVAFALGIGGEAELTEQQASSQPQPKSHFDVARNFVQNAVGDAIMREVNSVILMHSLESTTSVLRKDDSVSIRDEHSTDNAGIKTSFKPYEQTISVVVSEDTNIPKEDVQRLSDLSDKENVDMIENNQINSKKSHESKAIAKVEQWRSAHKADLLIQPTTQPDTVTEKPVPLSSSLAKDKNKNGTDKQKPFTPAHVTTVRLDSPSQTQQLSSKTVTSESSLTVARLPVESNLLFSPVSMLSIGDLSDGEMTDATDFTMDMLVRQNELHAAEEYGSKERVLLLQHHAASRIVSKTSSTYTRETGVTNEVTTKTQTNVPPQAETVVPTVTEGEGNGTPGVTRKASFKDLLSSFEAKSTPFMRGLRRQHNQQTEGGQSSSGEETSISGGVAAGESASQCDKPFILQLDTTSLDAQRNKSIESDDVGGVNRPQWRRF